MGYQVNITTQNVKYDGCYRILSSETTFFNKNKNNDLS